MPPPRQPHSVPRSRLPFKTSRAVLGLMLATLLLAVLLAFSTIRNINRAQRMMENFLLDKGATIIRSIEAGSRTSMMHHMGSGDPLHTLLDERSREEDILFISIMAPDGTVIDQAGHTAPHALSDTEINQLLSTGEVAGKLNRDRSTYLVSKAFETRQMPMHRFPAQTRSWIERLSDSRKIITIGLYTDAFDAARKQDVQHTMFMGAILFLVGTAGLYFLFLYQRMRVARSTLADMKLYTDNVIESIPVGLLTLDADNNVVSCNKNTEELLGCTISSIQGRRVGDALPGCAFCISEICNDSLDHQAECATDTGRTIPIQLSCSSLVNDQGESIGKVLIIRDMTSIREMELQLERSRRMAALGKMAAGIAHEIRNPLGTLRGFAQYFGTKTDGADEKEYAALMISEVDRLNRTVSGLLQFARPRELQPQTVELDLLFQKISALMMTDFTEKGLNFWCTPHTGITLSADPDLLLQVLMNLLKNSIQACSEQGKVSLAATEEDGVVRISVSDDGHGLKEKDREKMFDPFFTTEKAGTGLGLAVSHQIVEQHKGYFEVLTAPEKGTTITVVLPKSQERDYEAPTR